jgi:hypothetical protein
MAHGNEYTYRSDSRKYKREFALATAALRRREYRGCLINQQAQAIDDAQPYLAQALPIGKNTRHAKRSRDKLQQYQWELQRSHRRVAASGKGKQK